MGEGLRSIQPRALIWGPLDRDRALRLLIALVLFAGTVWLAAPEARQRLLAALGEVRTGAPAAAGGAQGDGWNSITVAGDEGGHFLVEATVNGVGVTFLVDSGASAVVLSPEDARRAGYRASQLRFTGVASTANGDVRLAPVSLRELRVGQLSLRGLPAVVNEAPMPVSLLGMTFLNRLEAWEAKRDRLVLYW
jgi:clan AA aspartic protease (TIGR02281 family)